jgi:hypothetical protein
MLDLSEGGFRAMLGFLATIEAAKELEIWDLVSSRWGRLKRSDEEICRKG